MGVRVVEILPDQETAGFETLEVLLILPMGRRMEVVIYSDPWIGGIDHFDPLNPTPQKRG
jgi:hypothetical protein